MGAATSGFVIGVDTHRDRHQIAIIQVISGALVIEESVPAGPDGYAQVLQIAARHAPGRRCWVIEGTGSYGHGLLRVLLGAGEQVAELARPPRRGRGQAKTDQLDAVLIARAALTGERLAVPRDPEGTREALRVLMIARTDAVDSAADATRRLRAIILTAPESLRESLRNLTPARLIGACRTLGVGPTDTPATAASCAALASLAERIHRDHQHAKALQHQITGLIRATHPGLLEMPGVGPFSAAQILISYSHHGRCRDEAAFASLAGVAPIPASSGQTHRHRLNRGGDRQLNRAIHTIAITRSGCHPETRAFLDRQTRNGKTRREAIRNLKRYLARSIYRHLNATPPPG